MPPLGWLNLHPSLLPRWRGPSPIQTALLEGDAETGVTIMRVVLEMDAGDIVLQESTLIGPEETAGDLTERLAAMGAPVDLAHPREEGGEPVADLVASRAAPHGADIGGDVIVRAIDEFPVLMVAATQAAPPSGALCKCVTASTVSPRTVRAGRGSFTKPRRVAPPRVAIAAAVARSRSTAPLHGPYVPVQGGEQLIVLGLHAAMEASGGGSPQPGEGHVSADSQGCGQPGREALDDGVPRVQERSTRVA